MTTPNGIQPAVAAAIEELRHAFPDNALTWLPDGNGGAHVILDNLVLGPAFTPSHSWVGFQITGLYPRADIYPHYVRADLVMADGSPLRTPLNSGRAMPGFDRAAVMVSRRRRQSATADTAVLKLQRVLEWFAQQQDVRRAA